MTVYLIGAGPGDPGLLTVRGHALLQVADVILHDRLISRDLLLLAKPDARIIDVGKKPGGRRTSQEEINHLLVAYGGACEVVVRLKGGDPFVFGRGGEELQTVKEAGIAVEVVPGITSAVAVPAYAGIPVTHRHISTSFTVITGHESAEKSASTLDYGVLAHLQTLIFLMGVGNLPQIAAGLMAHGRDPETPAACVEWGTFARQRVLTGTLEAIATVAKEENLSSPAVIIIGEVAGLMDNLSWEMGSPLEGKTIALVGRTQPLAAPLVAQGAWVVHFNVADERLYNTCFDLVLVPRNLQLQHPLMSNSLELDLHDCAEALDQVTGWFCAGHLSPGVLKNAGFYNVTPETLQVR